MKNEKNAIATEKRYIALMKQKMEKEMAELQSQQKKLSDQESATKNQRDSMLNSIEAQRAQMQAALEAADKAKAPVYKQNPVGVETAIKKVDALKQDWNTRASSVDIRLEGVESDLAEVKLLLKTLL